MKILSTTTKLTWWGNGEALERGDISAQRHITLLRNTEEEESEKNLCLLQNLLRVCTCRGMRPEYLLVWSTCGQISPNTACLCTYTGTPSVCVCVRTYMCVHTFFMCNHVLSACSCCSVCSSTESWRRKVCFSLFLSDPSHKHFPHSCRIRIHTGGFDSLINPVKRTPESFCVIYLPLFVKSSLTSMFTHRLPRVHADICLHAIAADCESHRLTRSCISSAHTCLHGCWSEWHAGEPSDSQITPAFNNSTHWAPFIGDLLS